MAGIYVLYCSSFRYKKGRHASWERHGIRHGRHVVRKRLPDGTFQTRKTFCHGPRRHCLSILKLGLQTTAGFSAYGQPLKTNGPFSISCRRPQKTCFALLLLFLSRTWHFRISSRVSTGICNMRYSKLFSRLLLFASNCSASFQDEAINILLAPCILFLA